MNIVTSGENKVIQIYPRTIIDGGTYQVEMAREFTNEIVTASVTGNLVDDKIELNLPFQFLENRFYYVRVFSGGLETYRGKIFCTNQNDLSKYSVNDSFFKQPSGDGMTFNIKGDYYGESETTYDLFAENSESITNESLNPIEIEH